MTKPNNKSVQQSRDPNSKSAVQRIVDYVNELDKRIAALEDKQPNNDTLFEEYYADPDAFLRKHNTLKEQPTATPSKKEGVWLSTPAGLPYIGPMTEEESRARLNQPKPDLSEAIQILSDYIMLTDYQTGSCDARLWQVLNIIQAVQEKAK